MVAQLFDLCLGEILLVLRAGQLLGDVLKIAENMFQSFADPFDLSLGLQNQRTLFGRQV